MTNTSIQRVMHRLPAQTRKMFALLLWLISWRNAAIIFFLLNVKVVPLAWELRLLYRGYAEWMTKPKVARLLEESAGKKGHSAKVPAHLHPLFRPHTLTTTTVPLEVDHNLHRSNSGFFTDMDESRTALMVRFLSSTKFSPEELDHEGYKGRLAILLGSVHCSFLKEIKPLTRYRVRSRILGWDEKWILIGSYFVRDKTRTEQKKDQGAGNSDTSDSEVLLAVGLSKYVIKKGRFTVPPERAWRSAGWLPEKPLQAATLTPQLSIATPELNGDASQARIEITEDMLKQKARNDATTTVGSTTTRQGTTLKEEDMACRQAANHWSWTDIETERVRGLKIAQDWLKLDKQLKVLWEEDRQRDIVE